MTARDFANELRRFAELLDNAAFHDKHQLVRRMKDRANEIDPRRSTIVAFRAVAIVHPRRNRA